MPLRPKSADEGADKVSVEDPLVRGHREGGPIEGPVDMNAYGKPGRATRRPAPCLLHVKPCLRRRFEAVDEIIRHLTASGYLPELLVGQLGARGCKLQKLVEV